MHLSWPLTGRSAEMRAIEAALAAPDVSGMVVRGAAGVGKSRIAGEALRAAANRGYQTRRAVGTSAARVIPLGAFTAWVPSDVTDSAQLVRGVIDSLTTASTEAPVLILIDDANLLDDLSTFVLHQIVQRGAAKVILTIRDGEPVPPSLQEIHKLGHFERIDLSPLSLDETATLVSTAVGAAVEPDATQRLWKLTRGNALYLRNIIEREVADGRFAQVHGHWRWTGDPVVPPDLVELIESRIGELPTAVAEVVDVLAVAEPIDLAALTRIVDAAAVEDAEVRGLITIEPDTDGVEVRVAHPLYGEVRRRQAPTTRQRRLRGLVATELAASDNHDDVRVVVRRAALSLDSDLTPDADLLVRAAHGAVWLADLALADKLAKAAVAAGAGPEAGFLRAHALSWLGRGEEADAVLARIPTGEASDDDLARLAFLRASNMLWALTDPEGAIGLIDDAAPSTPAGARAYIDAFRIVYWFATDHPEAAVQAAKSLALETLPSVVGAEIAWVLTTIAADAGRTGDAVALAEAGYNIAVRSLDAPQMTFNIADAHLSALLLSGRTADAITMAERVRRHGADLPGAAHLLGVAVAGRAALAGGNLDAACSLLEHSAVALSDAGYAIGWGYRYNISRATALAIHGSIDEAVTILDELAELKRTFRTLDYEQSLARAWVTAGQGAVGEAIAVLLSSAERASAKRQFAAEVICLQTAAQFGCPSCAARLRELEGTVEGPRVGVAARFAEALDNDDAAELSSASEAFENLGDIVAAADAAAHAALSYRRQDLRGSALRCSTRAKALAQRCGGASSPALRAATDDLPLTDREREIVTLIGAGFSNRAVAERLTLSIRTVESHIYRAMAKTGTANRDELAALVP